MKAPRVLALLASALVSLAPAVGRCAPGDLDPSFGTGGVAQGRAGIMLQILVDPTGRLVTTPL